MDTLHATYDQLSQSQNANQLVLRLLGAQLNEAVREMEDLGGAIQGTEARFGDDGIAYTVAYAATTFRTLNEALAAPNMTVRSIAPLVDALRKAFNMDEAKAGTRNLQDLEAALERLVDHIDVQRERSVMALPERALSETVAQRIIDNGVKSE